MKRFIIFLLAVTVLVSFFSLSASAQSDRISVDEKGIEFYGNFDGQNGLFNEELEPSQNEYVPSYTTPKSSPNDVSVAVNFGVFFLIIPLIIGVICLIKLIKGMVAPYDILGKILIITCGVIILCYLAVLVILII